jgi:hypothetical protein
LAFARAESIERIRQVGKRLQQEGISLETLNNERMRAEQLLAPHIRQQWQSLQH